MYLNGYSLFLNGGFIGNGFFVFGGMDLGDVIGNFVIIVNSIGLGMWYFYGGNNNGGILKGNLMLFINNMVFGINMLLGGVNLGIVDGNVIVFVKWINGVFFNYYGVGIGIAVNLIFVIGSVFNELDIAVEVNSFFRMFIYYGGVFYGNINGIIKNLLFGYGGWSLRGFYVGGLGCGNIGINCGINVIFIIFDVSNYIIYGLSIIGVNCYNGIIIGNIENMVIGGIIAV